MGPLTDSPARWGLVSRLLHWTTAVLLVVAAAVGWWLADLSSAYGAGRDDGSALTWAAAHHTLGFAVALLAFVRVNWRIQNERPAKPEGLDRFRLVLARVTQVLLVVLLFVFPLSGWAAVSTAPVDLPIFVFGWEIPRMYEEPPGTSLVHDLAMWVHEACLYVGGLLVAVHVTGVSLSQWRDGSGVLTRMWSGTDGR